MKKLNMKSFYLTLFVSTIGFSQVGIGTDIPTAELEIETVNTGIPALELNPQTAPVGSADGQIAVINGLIYMYDTIRGKWLSISCIPLQYGRNGNVDNARVSYGGNMNNNDSGPLMPLDGTIVGITARSSGGLATKQFQVRVRNGTTNQATLNFDLISNEYISFSVNQDFNAGDYLVVHAQNTGGSVANPSVVLWVKWRE